MLFVKQVQLISDVSESFDICMHDWSINYLLTGVVFHFAVIGNSGSIPFWNFARSQFLKRVKLSTSTFSALCQSNFF